MHAAGEAPAPELHVFGGMAPSFIDGIWCVNNLPESNTHATNDGERIRYSPLSFIMKPAAIQSQGFGKLYD
jgi:hypothetical protein